MSGETGSSGGQNAEFEEPESGADLEAVRSWAFETARKEPLKYATCAFSGKCSTPARTSKKPTRT
jgi:hypothetical protein